MIFKTIQEIFTKRFTINYDNNLYTIKLNNLKCLELTISIEDDEIQIIGLDKCYSTGRKLLDLVEKLSKKLGITKISLLDVSKIQTDCELSIDLGYLKILTNGISWYNSLGYVSSEFEEERRQNSEILQMPLIAAINEATQILINNFLSKNTIESIKTKLSYFIKKGTDESIIHKLNYQIDNYEIFQQSAIDSFLNNSREVMDEAIKYIDVSKSVHYCINALLKLVGKFNKTDEKSCKLYGIIDKLINILSELLIYSGILTKIIDLNDCDTGNSRCFSIKSIRDSFRFTRRGGKRKLQRTNKNVKKPRVR